MGKIELSLADDLRSYVDHEVEAGSFLDDATFIESLIRDHRQRKLGALLAALEDGERSGTSPRNFDQIIAAAREKHRSRES